MTNPKIILLFSGKRKSGKDFLTDHLYDKIGAEKSVIIRLSAPIKSQWAKKNDLEFEKLLGTCEYKEKHRSDMIQWSEAERCKDSGVFIRSAIEMAHAHEKPVWIVSDMRRRSDLQWFSQHYPQIFRTVRVECLDSVRTNRGWVFSPGIDDAETECDLDAVDSTTWTWRIQNNGSLQDVSDQLDVIHNTVESCLK